MVITAAHITPLVALIAGILILLMPRLLNLIVAIYLIICRLDGAQWHLSLHPLASDFSQVASDGTLPSNRSSAHR